MRYASFVNGSATEPTPLLDAELTMNWYPAVASSQGAKAQAALLPTPGFQAFSTPSGVVNARAALAVANTCYWVVGNELREVSASGSQTVLGTVVEDAYPATLAYNGAAGAQLFITSGGNGYLYNRNTGVFSQIAALNGIADSGGMIDGYFLAFDRSLAKVRISGLLDGTTWDPTVYFQNSITGDPWQAMVIRNREIILLGTQTGQAWYDAGAYPVPFAPIPGAVWNEGIAAPFAFGVSGDTVVWLAQSPRGAGTVVAMRSYTPEGISTPAVAYAISEYIRTSVITDATMLTYQDEGHEFFCLSFVAAAQTWVYDASVNLWHQRGRWVPDLMTYAVWNPSAYCYQYGKHLVGDRESGLIQEMSTAYTSDWDGSVIRRVRRAPGLFSEHRQVLIRRIEVYLESGVGLSTGATPVVLWRTSDDGGKTWGNYRQGSAGKQGEYQARVIWTRMGVSRDRVNEMVVSDPVPWKVVDAYINNDMRAA